MSKRPARKSASSGAAPRRTDASAALLPVVVALAREAERSKCTDVTVLDVAGINPVCDYLIIASGTSSRQMRSVADDLADLAEARGVAAWRRASDTGHSWIVVDLVHIVVHLFEPGQREYYDLEGLWRDGDRVDWRKSAAEEETVDTSPSPRRRAKA